MKDKNYLLKNFCRTKKCLYAIENLVENKVSCNNGYKCDKVRR